MPGTGIGSFNDRMGHVSVWNTVMDEHNYVTRAWTRFVSDVNGKSR